MDEIKKASNLVDKLRESLKETIEKRKGELTDYEVVKISQELDVALNQYIELLGKKE